MNFTPKNQITGICFLFSIFLSHQAIAHPACSDIFRRIHNFAVVHDVPATRAWLAESNNFSIHYLPNLMLKNGALRAASDDRYGFYWVRDGAYVYSSYLKALDMAAWDQMRAYVDMTRLNQTEPTYSQKANGPAYHNSQAKFILDGTSVSDWMPQGDGPGLRSATLMQFAYSLLKEALENNKPQLIKEVRTKLYDSKYGINSQSAIKYDLASLGLPNSFGEIMAVATDGEAWEEKWARNFSNKLENRAALLLGSVFALNENLLGADQNPGDKASSSNYLDLAAIAKRELQKHWDKGRNYLIVTLPEDPARGEDPNSMGYKVSGLDTQVILASIQMSKLYFEFSRIFSSSQFFSNDLLRLEGLRTEFEDMGVIDPRVRATYLALKKTFTNIYTVNTDSRTDARVAPAWGRYPEDRYAGDGNSYPNGGNPWILTTQGAGMFQALNAILSFKKGFISIAADGTDLNYFADISPEVKAAVANNQIYAGQIIRSSDPLFTLILQGWRDNMIAYADRVKRHSYQKIRSDGTPDPNYLHMNEQFDRNYGDMTSVENLAWNYGYQIEFNSLLNQLDLALLSLHGR